MGKTVSSLGGAGNILQTGMSGGLMGDNPISQALGLSGAQGEYYQNNTRNPALEQLGQRAAMINQPGVARSLSDYGTGQGSLQDALHAGGLIGAQQDELQQRLAIDPMSGSRFATDQVQSNPILGQLYGQNGALSDALAQQKNLEGQGFQLTPEDHEAYGQMSGNIARMFGSQEQGLAQSLADRGLGASPSGAASIEFTGLQGNKNEQLKNAQMQIANQRYDRTQSRLNNLRDYSSKLGGQAETAINDQFSRQLNGAKQNADTLHNTADLYNNFAQINNQANQASMTDKRGAKGKTLLEGLGNGLFQSSQTVGAAPGRFASSAAGGAGAAG